jgi:hypothetical protein
MYARDYVARRLAEAFERYYSIERIKPGDYRANLDDFLRGLFRPNKISYPSQHKTAKRRDNFLKSIGLI